MSVFIKGEGRLRPWFHKTNRKRLLIVFAGVIK